MKKLSMREKLIIAIIVLIGGGYALYQYYLQPRMTLAQNLNSQIATLQPTANQKNSVYDQLSQLRKKSEGQKTRISAYKQTSNTFDLNAQNLLAFIGPVAESHKVSITLFKQLTDDTGKANAGYTNMPFHIVLQGDYSNLLKVIDSLSGLNYNYTLSEYSMKVIDVDPKTNKPVEQLASSTEYKWTSGKNTYVTGEFPLFNVDNVESQTNTGTGQTTAGTSGTSGSAGTQTDTTKHDFIPIKKVQIEFKLNFIVFPDQKQNKKDNVQSSENTNNDPFQSKVPDTVKKNGYGDDYTGDELIKVTDSQRASFMVDKTLLDKEINKTLVAIYNREQKKMKTDQQLAYLKELLAIRNGTSTSSSNPSSNSSSTNTDAQNPQPSDSTSSSTSTATNAMNTGK